MMAGRPRTDLEVSGRAHPDADTWILYFPWPTNPLPMNGGHGHFRAHARKVRQVKDQVRYGIRAAQIPALGRCEAAVTWWVPNNRIRDVDNLGELEKRMYDALVLEQVVADDRPALMDKLRGRITHVDDADGLVTGPGFTLRVRRLDSETGE